MNSVTKNNDQSTTHVLIDFIYFLVLFFAHFSVDSIQFTLRKKNSETKSKITKKTHRLQIFSTSKNIIWELIVWTEIHEQGDYPKKKDKCAIRN